MPTIITCWTHLLSIKINFVVVMCINTSPNDIIIESVEVGMAQPCSYNMLTLWKLSVRQLRKVSVNDLTSRHKIQYLWLPSIRG